MCRTPLSLTILALLSLAAVADAAPIIYSEVVDGDLPDNNPIPVLVLDLGINSVSGTLDNTPDFDSFAFTVPAGMEMSSGSLVVSDLAGDVTDASWSLRQGSTAFAGALVDGGVGALSPGADTFGPVAAGTYNLSPISIGSAGGGFHSAGYTFNFTVASIPEPGTLSVLALGALALLGRRHRSVAVPIRKAVRGGPALCCVIAAGLILA